MALATATDVQEQKQLQKQKDLSRCQTSRLLQCFRAIGMIVDDVPIVWYSMGKESFATASLGKSFVVYKCDKLTPVLVSPQLPKKIRALAVMAKKQITFTACGQDILVWKRVEHVQTLSGHLGSIKQLLSVGNVLFSLDDAQEIRIWDIESMELLNVLTCPPGFTPSVIMHPATYLNKIFIGSEEGLLQLWNIRTMTCLFTFQPRGKQSTPSAVTSLMQSPAVDVVGVGFADGTVLMHHLALDQRIMQFHQTQGRVTALTFRTDTAADAPVVATGTLTGDIALWNLANQRLEAIIPHAHEGAITALVFLQNEPLLLTTGVDNSIKLWIFDQVSVGSARLLKSREGHHGPPTRIRYYGSNTLATMAEGADGTSCQILSSGQDRAFRVFHTAREQQSTEMAQGALLKTLKRSMKLPPITQFYAMETRERDWSNVVTCHENEGAAYVWRFEHRTINGKRILRQYDPRMNRVTPGSTEALRQQQTHANCVTISTCGHYALVGGVGGAIYRYNMQSGEKRGSYPTAATPKPAVIRGLVLPGTPVVTVEEDATASHAHDGPVSGVVVDALNALVVSGGMDGKLKFWDFRTHQLVYEVNLSGTSAAISQLELYRDSNLLAVACDDQVVRVMDIHTRKLVRRFTGHTHRLTDLQFSRDGRWLFTSSADATMRVWDLPTAKCIDWIKFQKPVTSLAVSPTGEFIATTHVGQVGLFLWANRAYFMDVLVDNEPKAPVLLDMPVPVNEVENENVLGSEDVSLTVEVTEEPERGHENKESKTENVTVDPLEASLITLSTAPRAYWESLFNLELIKKRNKPVVPPKAPEQAPFFLHTARKEDVQPTFVPIAKVQKTSHLPSEPSKAEETVSEMAGWGVGDDDESWGPEDEAMEEDKAERDATNSSSRILKSSGIVTARCKLAQLLMEAVEVDEEDPRSIEDQACWSRRSRFARVINYLQTLSASAVDVEFQTLCMGDFDTEGIELLGHFLQCLEEEMATRRHFQVLQAYLNRFLKLYEHLMVDSPMLLARIDALCMVQSEQWDHLQRLLHNNLCLVQYFSKIQM